MDDVATAVASGLELSGHETRELANLKIVDVQALSFRYPSRLGYDEEGHAHPVPEREVMHTLTRVRTSVGIDGY